MLLLLRYCLVLDDKKMFETEKKKTNGMLISGFVRQIVDVVVRIDKNRRTRLALCCFVRVARAA